MVAIKFEKTVAAHDVRKLWALPDGVYPSLIRRGIDPDSFVEATDALDGINAVLTPTQAIEQSFTPYQSSGSYGIGRYGDGSHGVCYTAMELETCIAEVGYHVSQRRLQFYKQFRVVKCAFRGTIANLCGQEKDHQDLISKDESGYAFCRLVAKSAIKSGVQAFHAPSARKEGGVCVPVFERRSLSNEVLEGAVRYSKTGDKVVAEQL